MERVQKIIINRKKNNIIALAGYRIYIPKT